MVTKKTKLKGKQWDGITRPSTDLYKKNFDRIFGKKTEDEIQKENEEYLEEIKSKL
jgi:hypothetical protein|tara:strand:+ start:436 stop:603 length:168 start_codon:yes stop_codon:yes gene_type:complete